MKHLDKVPKEEIKEDFLAVADRFADYVYDCGKVKEIFGKSIQGETFCFLIERYLAMVQDGSLVIENAFDYVIKHTNNQAVNQAIEELGNHFNVRLPISESDVQAIADKAMSSAMDVFNSKAINVNDQEDEVSKLIKLINDACIDFASKNYELQHDFHLNPKICNTLALMPGHAQSTFIKTITLATMKLHSELDQLQIQKKYLDMHSVEI